MRELLTILGTVTMCEPADSLVKRIRLYWRGVLCLVLLAPVTLPADEAGEPPPYFEWQAVNYEINAPLGGLTGVVERGRAIASDQLRGNCIACHRLPIPEKVQGKSPESRNIG